VNQRDQEVPLANSDADEVGGRLEPGEPSAQVKGIGVPRGANTATPDMNPAAALGVTEEEGLTRVRIEGLQLVLVRVLGTRIDSMPECGGASATLRGIWSGQAEPMVLAGLTLT
jgi:hypothetical protein